MTGVRAFRPEGAEVEIVVPAQAGTYPEARWVPALAGATEGYGFATVCTIGRFCMSRTMPSILRTLT